MIRVIANEQDILCGRGWAVILAICLVPQGSILGPQHFFLYTVYLLLLDCFLWVFYIFALVSHFYFSLI